ncbi:MAG TPA: substrate-binding domain-containing protein [Candidatus Limnocylindrales bacterium]|jgi:ribose transport system substrate-binding protein
MSKGSLRNPLVGLATIVLIAACAAPAGSSSPAASAPAASEPAASEPAASASTGASGPFTIAFSNTGGTGNGFREEQNCTAKAQALASGEVDKVDMIARDADVNQQLADLRTLIANSPDALVFNPSNADGLQAALDEAQAAGIKTVAVDAYVNDPETYNLYNNQVKYAELGAKWLFDQLNGQGTVYYMRGIAGHPADTDRDVGFKNVLKDYPGITVVPSADGVATGWNPAEATKLANEFIQGGGYDSIDGIWTSGIDSEVVDAIKASGKPFVPIVGTDRGSFTAQLLDPAGYPDLKGAAVTNTAAVGGAGVALALKLLKGEAVETDPTATKPNTVLLDPVLADNLDDAGKATLDSWQSVPGLTATWPLGLEIPGWTTYSPEQAVACKGPGE